jgi:TRAP-type uncharacterized transport system fused permease subunit
MFQKLELLAYSSSESTGSVIFPLVICVISLTGFGVKISQLIISLAGVSHLLALTAAMVTALVLGMQMTRTASYAIAPSVLTPALQSLYWHHWQAPCSSFISPSIIASHLRCALRFSP